MDRLIRAPRRYPPSLIIDPLRILKVAQHVADLKVLTAFIDYRSVEDTERQYGQCCGISWPPPSLIIDPLRILKDLQLADAIDVEARPSLIIDPLRILKVRMTHTSSDIPGSSFIDYRSVEDTERQRINDAPRSHDILH